MGGDGLQHGRLAGNGEVALGAGLGEFARAGLIAFLIHQTDKEQFGVLRTRPTAGDFAQRMKKRGDTTIGVACAAAEQAAEFNDRLKQSVLGRHHIEMRREDYAVPHLAGGRKAHE